jgi:hypothetical protein
MNTTRTRFALCLSSLLLSSAAWSQAPTPQTPPAPAAACTWADGQDPAGPRGDTGRGVSDWRAHFAYITAGTRAGTAAMVFARFEALRGCLSAGDFARLYADISTQIAYYGRRGAGWLDRPDTRAGADGGRGIASYQAHYDFAADASRGATASGFVRQRLTDLNGPLSADAYAHLYADVSILVARYGRPH